MSANPMADSVAAGVTIVSPPNTTNPATPNPAMGNNPSQTMAQGGMTNKFSLSSIPWMEIGIAILGVAALMMIIKASRKKILAETEANHSLAMRLDGLEADLQKVKTQQSKKRVLL